MPAPATLSRRRLLRLLGGAATTAVLVGCGAAAEDAAPTSGGYPAQAGDEAAKPVVKPADSSKDSADAHGAPGPASHDDGQPSFGPTYVIKDRIVNLADPTVRRYLRFSVAIEFAPHGATKASAAPTDAGAWTHLIGYTPRSDGYQPVAGGKDDPEKEFRAHIKRYVPAIEDAVMTLLSSKTYAEVATADRRESAKREIKTRLGALLDGTDLHVTSVYFTDVVVQ
jgi:flagellar basal body-associated protein FliL